jgi:hypothetical protein
MVQILVRLQIIIHFMGIFKVVLIIKSILFKQNIFVYLKGSTRRRAADNQHGRQ